MPSPKKRRYLYNSISPNVLYDSIVPSSLYIQPATIDPKVIRVQTGVSADKMFNKEYDVNSKLRSLLFSDRPYIKLTRPAVVSRPRNSDLIKRAKQAFPRDTDRYQMYKDIDDMYYDYIYNEKQGTDGGPEKPLKNLLDLWELASKPVLDNEGKGLFVNTITGFPDRPNYVPDRNKIYQAYDKEAKNLLPRYIDELSHAIHGYYKGLDELGYKNYSNYAQMLDNFIGYGVSDARYILPNGKISNNYDNPNHFEYFAHHGIKPAILQAMRSSASDFKTLLTNSLAKAYPNGVPRHFKKRSLGTYMPKP